MYVYCHCHARSKIDVMYLPYGYAKPGQATHESRRLALSILEFRIQNRARVSQKWWRLDMRIRRYVINKAPSFQVFDHTGWETRQTAASAETPEDAMDRVRARQQVRRGQIKTDQGQLDMILHKVMRFARRDPWFAVCKLADWEQVEQLNGAVRR